MKLKGLDALVVDCQSTGANPERGRLLELGWKRLRGGPTVSTLVKLPKGHEIPGPVARITGIAPEDLEMAEKPAEVWKSFASAAKAASRRPLPLIIHFARFEEPFLRRLHKDRGRARKFAHEILCTHEIARRLLPGLPRLGLRALAGYFGHGTSQLRRSAEHVDATVFVWNSLVSLLAEEGIETLVGLRKLLASPVPAKGRGRAYPLERAKRLSLPDAPGVYRMLRRNGDILYVGKATSLKKRVNSYFQKRRKVPERTLEMLTQAHALEVTRTATALEAALLETDEIKRAAPPYNVALRGEGRLWYASRDLKNAGETPDRARAAGPFRSRDGLDAFNVLRKLSGRKAPKPSEEDIAALFGGPPERLPGIDLVKKGLRLFVRRELGGTELSVGKTLLLGARLWRERKKLMELEREAEDEEEGEEPEEFVWDVESVHSALRSIVRHTAHDLRRARWFLRLSESALAWSEGGRWRRLAVSRGRIDDGRDFDAAADLTPPAGHRRKTLARQKVLDAAALDRLTILTTHLRSMAAGSSATKLTLRPGETLDARELARRLYWL